ncbi:GNAT family N-acetyltransferase [Flavobacterium sp. GT3R68]|uniref:GNAT family N-acetyltransferase n=1 Tax=Flavobacterium sp. GT3R68 TaxID=2594437 RepID=UPI000F862FF0|nr:GNAT family N-acetyltransferase [Flavobacterium sp. GT3R68]RTY89122.1 GNAT family N-acetyltransferase [Flavobacterium sp. GSN2]TRW90080.1 GNAT family N-acetyltransferase [Flavobacterium sp. GT3R68]
MIIREYKPSDKSRIMELLKLNTPEYFAPAEEQDLMDYLNNHLENYYVVEENGFIVGCGGFNRSDDPEIVRISWDIINPESQGKGVGTALTKFRIQKIKELKNIKAIVVRTTQLVYPFYEKLGFKLKSVEKDYWAPGFDLYYMDQKADSFHE